MKEAINVSNDSLSRDKSAQINLLGEHILIRRVAILRQHLDNQL